MTAVSLLNMQKDAADLRRDQLVDIASRLIETDGIDAVKHTAIAKLAGCTRSLIYHYFPKRSDIFFAINAAFYTRLDALMPAEQQQAAVLENLEGDKPNSLRLFGLLFDLLEQGGWASLIISSTPELHSGFADNEESLHDDNEARWINIIASRFQMNPIDSELFYQHTINIAKTIFLFYRKGRLNKKQAIETLDSTLNQLLNSYR